MALVRLAALAPARALDLLREALGLRRALFRKDPASRQARRDLFVVLSTLGTRTGEVGLLEEALALARAALVAEQQGGEDEQEPSAEARADLASALEACAVTRARAGDFARSQAAFEEVLRLREALAAAAPQDLEAARALGFALNNLARVAQRRGDHDAAWGHFARSLRLSCRLLERAPRRAALQADLYTSLARLAALAIELERGDEAREPLREVQARLEQLRAAQVPLDSRLERLVVDLAGRWGR